GYGRLQIDADAVALLKADAPKAVGEARGLAGHVSIAQATIAVNQRLLAGTATSARPKRVMDEKVHEFQAALRRTRQCARPSGSSPSRAVRRQWRSRTRSPGTRPAPARPGNRGRRSPGGHRCP